MGSGMSKVLGGGRQWDAGQRVLLGQDLSSAAQEDARSQATTVP